MFFSSFLPVSVVRFIQTTAYQHEVVQKKVVEYFLSKEEIRDNLLKFSLSGWVFLFYKSVNV